MATADSEKKMDSVAAGAAPFDPGLADVLAALTELTIAAEAAGWDLSEHNAPILNAARAALAKAS